MLVAVTLATPQPIPCCVLLEQLVVGWRQGRMQRLWRRQLLAWLRLAPTLLAAWQPLGVAWRQAPGLCPTQAFAQCTLLAALMAPAWVGWGQRWAPRQC